MVLKGMVTSSPFVSKVLLNCIEENSNVIDIFKPTRKLISYKNSKIAKRRFKY